MRRNDFRQLLEGSIKNKWGTRYEGSYSCSEYRKDVQYQGKRKCTCHFIRESQLEQASHEFMLPFGHCPKLPRI